MLRGIAGRITGALRSGRGLMMGPQPLLVWTFGGTSLADLFASDTRHFRTEFQINPYMRVTEQPDLEAAKAKHRDITDAHRALGRRIEYPPSVPGCPDMVYPMKGEVSPGVRWRRNPARRYAGPRPASTRRRAEAFHHRPVTLLLTEGPR
jgi:hypothetical protein